MARSIVVQILGDASSLLRAFKKSESGAKGFDRAMGKAGAKTRGLFKGFAGPALAGLGIGGIADTILGTVQAASDLNEEVSKNKVVFGQSAGAILAWSKTTANALGISRTEALQATGTFGTLLEGMGLLPAKAAQTSRSLVQLAGDMASFNNANPQDVLEAMRAALVGEFEPLRRYGVQLSQNKVNQEAFRLGLAKSVTAAQNAKTAYKGAAAAFKTASQAQTKATQQLSKAQTELGASQRAVQSSTAAVTAAQEHLQAASQGVTSAEDRQQTASERLTAAKHALTAAQKAGRDAQVALTQARKQATEQLKELKGAAVDAALGEQRAQLSLAQARQHLTEVMADSNSTELDRRDAVLSVKEAERSAQEATDRRKDSAKKARDADKKGVEGAKVVVDARKQVAKAHQAEQTATTRVAAAQRGLLAAQQGMANALGKVAKAQTDLATAQANASAANERYTAAQTKLVAAQQTAQTATDRAKKAEDALAEAKKKSDALNKGGTKTLSDYAKAQAILSLIFGKTTKQQGDAHRTGNQLAGSQRRAAAEAKDLEAVLGGKLAPSVTDVTNKFANWLSKGENQKKIMDAFNTLIGVLHAVRDAFKAVNKVTGSTKHTLELLIGVWATWKIAGPVGKLRTLYKHVGTLKSRVGGARGAFTLLRGSMLGKLGLAGAALGLGLIVGTMIRNLTPLGDYLDDLAAKFADLTDPMKQFGSIKQAASQNVLGQARREAGTLARAGATPQQIVTFLMRAHPMKLAQWDAESIAGVRGRAPTVHYNIQNLNVHGGNLQQLEDALLRRAKKRPRSRR